MAKIGESALKEQIKSGEFVNAYFIYGEESYLKEFYISQLKKKLVDPAFDSFNLHEFEGKDTELDDILKDAQMLPMMSEYNLVLVRDYPIERSKNDLKLLKEFLEDVPETTVFVFYFDAKETDIKSASFKSLVSCFDKHGAVVNLEKRSESDVAKLLISGAKKRGAVLSLDNARYLISVAGNDMKTLLNELDKLSYYINGGEITKEIIDSMAVKCLQAKIYELSNAVVAGNSGKAYSVLNTLLYNKEEPTKLNAAIGGVYIDMYRVKCAKAAGFGYDDVAKHFNYKGREFALRNASRDCAKLTEKQLRASLDTIMESDLRLKSTAADKKLVLEELIAKLILIVRENRYA